MPDARTWVILTDGYYIKVMYYQDENGKLNTYRDDDFENSSKITYNLITRKRVTGNDNGHTVNESSDIDGPGYLLKQLDIFLSDKIDTGACDKLVFVAPRQVLDNIEDKLSDKVLNSIISRVPGDYMSMAQDRLEIALDEFVKD